MEWMMRLFLAIGISFTASLLQEVLPVFAIDQWLYPFPHQQGPPCTYKHHSFSIRLIQCIAAAHIHLHIQTITTNKIKA